MKSKLNILDTVLSVLVISASLIIGNISTNKIVEYLEKETPKAAGIQVIDDLPNFIVDVNTYMPGKFLPLVRLEVEINKKTGNVTGTHCSGTVINDDYVLTAAHCLVDKDGFLKKTIFVRSHNYGLTETELTSSQLAIPAAINIRADIGLVKGNFRLFSKMPIDVSSVAGPNIHVDHLQNCGFPWGDRMTCYSVIKLNYCGIKYCGKSLVYPAMSGGPLIDMTSNRIVAVNLGYTDTNVVFNPLIGLFSSFGMKVEYK